MIDNMADRNLTNTKEIAQSLLGVMPGGVKATYSGHLKFGQLCVSVLLTGLIGVASLPHLVGVVDCVGAQKQVSGVAAGRVVAGVENLLAFGNLIMGEYPGYSMSTAHRLFREQTEQAIAFRQPARSPEPTGVGTAAHIDLRPEAFHTDRFNVEGCYPSEEY